MNKNKANKECVYYDSYDTCALVKNGKCKKECEYFEEE